MPSGCATQSFGGSISLGSDRSRLQECHLKQSGMFWTVRGANAILALRCCHHNGRFEDYPERLEFHFYLINILIVESPKLYYTV